MRRMVGIVVEYTRPDGSKYCVRDPDDCCPGSGSAAGSDGSGPTCCPDHTPPDTLTATLAAGTPCCAGHSPDFPILRDPATGIWSGTAPTNDACPSTPATISMRCDAGSGLFQARLQCGSIDTGWVFPDCGYTCQPYYFCRAGILFITE